MHCCSTGSPARGRGTAGKTLVLALAAAIAAAPPWAPVPRPAHAVLGVGDAVFCMNCADYATQLWQYAKEAEQLAETITMRITQAQMRVSQLQNMASLPGQVWHQIEGNFAQTQALFQRGVHLKNSASAIAANLNGYRSLIGTAVDMPAQYARWSDQANDSIKSSLAGFGLMQGQMSSDRAVVSQIRARSAGADGAVRAIQANTEMGGAQVNELHRLREIMLQHANMAANMHQISAERQAAAEAAQANFFAVPEQAERGNRRF